MVSNGVIYFDGGGGITTYIFQKCVSKFVMSPSFFLQGADQAVFLVIKTKQSASADSISRSSSHLQMQIALQKLLPQHNVHV